MTLHLYAVFHLNLAFSSIEEEQRPRVIQNCYWPLLQLIRDQQLPLGIEATGYTLETIASLDPAWIAALRELCLDGPAEFVGSGYAQLIGPLVPGEVNRHNQQQGVESYQRLLGLTPVLALVNEQAFSAGLVEHYLQAGYQGLIMEWDNPYRSHPDWNPELRYLPQRVRGTGGAQLPLIWNKSLPFQQFQRYAHGEWELKNYLPQLERHLSDRPRVFSLYGNDAEIFDFRPGRFATEARASLREWPRIGELFARLQADERFAFIPPGGALEFLDQPGAGTLLELQTAASPIPVKKQAKYNITRWAVTGRDDLQINSRCQRLYGVIKDVAQPPERWRELCYLWSSDFRTHITERRWQAYLHRLQQMEASLGVIAPKLQPWPVGSPDVPASAFKLIRDGELLEVRTEVMTLHLNLRRGLAIEHLGLAEEPDKAWLGTLPHGFFDHIDLAADYYTGHLVVEIPGDHKVTDLGSLEPRFSLDAGQLVISGQVETPLGPIEKRLLVAPHQPHLQLQYRLGWSRMPQGAVRLGHLTLPPGSYEAKELFFSTHNGGCEPETFFVKGEAIDHLASVTPLVTASQGLGLTAGILTIGDQHRRIQVTNDPSRAALTAHIIHRPLADSYLFRVVFSARELDDSCCASRLIVPQVPSELSLKLSLQKSI